MNPAPGTEPSLTVLVPVYQGARVLPRCLDALLRSDLDRTEWELVVVDDGSTDDTASLAADRVDRVVRVPDGPRGPAYARNAGAVGARGRILVFVDADVLVHPDTLRRFRDLFRDDPDVHAAFGAYDDSPADPGLISQYRNLLHRYVHLEGAGDTETFWAGCGAVRRDVFERLGGFDAEAYPRPQIEDIELGYRVRANGGRIVLDPAIQATHLKRWTAWGMVRCDLFDRGVPWMRLLLRSARSGDRRSASLNVRLAEKVRTGLVGLGLAVLAAGALIPSLTAALVGLVALGGVLLSNHRLFRWFRDRRGVGFVLGVVPLNLLYYVVSGSAVLLAWTLEFTGDRADGPDHLTARDTS